MAPIRVLHIVTTMDTGGIETFLMNFYRNIDRTKVQFDFLTHRTEEAFYDSEIKNLGGKIYSVPRINPFNHKCYLEELDMFFNDHPEYKIVHSHINTFSLYPLRSAKKNQVPIRIAHSHISSVPIDLKTPFRIYTKARLTRYTTHNFAASKKAGDWLFGKNKTINNYNVLNNAINVENFIYNKLTRKKIRYEFNITDELVIGHVGRLVKQKNHQFLIDIFYEVHKIYPNSKLILVGEGNLREKISKKVKKLKLEDSVIFTGVRKDVNKVMQAFDVFLLPSIYEGLGIVAIESQAAGITTIVSDVLPSEAYITENISSLSLKEGPKVWAKYILQNKDNNIKNTFDTIVEAEYDIKSAVNKLQNFYLNLKWENKNSEKK